MAVNKYNPEESRKHMEYVVSKGVKDRGFFRQLYLATIAAFLFLMVYLLVCLGLFVGSVLAVQGSQYLCLESGVCKR